VVPELFAVLLIFSFQFYLLFFHVRQPGSTAAYVVCPISDIAENLGRYLFCTERSNQENDFELTLTVKIKLDIP